MGWHSHQVAHRHYDRVARAQAREENLKKEAMLDDLLKAAFGYGCHVKSFLLSVLIRYLVRKQRHSTSRPVHLHLSPQIHVCNNHRDIGAHNRHTHRHITYTTIKARINRSTFSHLSCLMNYRGYLFFVTFCCSFVFLPYSKGL